MGSCRTVRPRATRPDPASLRSASRRCSHRATGAASGLSGPAAPRPAPPPALTKTAPPGPPGPLHHFGVAPSFPGSRAAGRVETKAAAAARGQRGRAGAGAHQSAALSSRITSSYAASSCRRWPLKLTPAMLTAAPRPDGRRTDGRTEAEGRDEGAAAAAASEPLQRRAPSEPRPGEGSRPAGGGGRWLRPARPSALGPSAAPARPRGRPAPPSRPAPGAPRPSPPPRARCRAGVPFASEARLSRVPSPRPPCPQA